LKRRGHRSCVFSSMIMINSVLLWWTDSVPLPVPLEIAENCTIKIRAENASAKLRQSNRRTKLTIELNLQRNYFTLVGWHFRSKNNCLGEICWHVLITFLVFGNHKRRRVLGNVWTHHQLSASRRIIWKEPDFTGEKPAQISPISNFIVILNGWTWNENCSLWITNVISFFFKENIRHPVPICRDPISLILGTLFSILETRIGSLKHLKNW